MEEFLDIVRREAQQIVASRQWKGSVVATSYDPKTHSIKGIHMPSEVETGWIPLSAIQAGDGYGVMAGPTVGSAEKLDGDVFDLDFENGDPNWPIARHKHFSNSDNPPEVKSGEVLVKSQAGGSTHFKQDKSIRTTHADGGYVEIDKDGNHIHDTNNKNVTINAGSGSQTFKAKGHSFDGPVNVKGSVTATENIGAPTLSGTLSGGGMAGP